MNPNLLKLHKRADKRLSDWPAFKQLRRGRLPKPLDKMGGARLFATDLMPVSECYQICFAWRDGELRADSAFFAWLFNVSHDGLFPLAALHYHPSHTPVHLLTPCRDDRNFTNRQLPGVPEFVVSGESFDPRQISDRQRLVALFCHRCGVTLGASGDLFS